MAKRLRVGILGAGRIGAVHALALAHNTDVELGWIYDPLIKAARSVQEETGVAIASTLEQVIEDETIDLLIVCTPTPTHTQIIKRAVIRGKAVYCEKPLALTLKESLECIRFVDKRKGRLMVGLNRRFDPDFSLLKQQIDSGLIGKTEYVQITSRDPGLPPLDYLRQSGGLFMDMTIHDFDMALYLLPEPPVAISAFASVQVDPKIAELDNDSATVTLVTKHGCICHIHNSRRAAYGYDQRIEIFGSKGMVQNRNHNENALIRSDTKGIHQAVLKNFFLERYMVSYQLAVKFFIAALLGDEKKQAQAKKVNGINAIYLATAAAKSYRSRKFEPLKLPYS